MENSEIIKIGCQLQKKEIYEFLVKCNGLFVKKLSSIVDLKTYSEKLSNNSRQICYYIEDELIGMWVLYVNDLKDKTAFIPIICVLEQYHKRGIGGKLYKEAAKYVKKMGFNSFMLEVYRSDDRARAIYQSFGFKIIEKRKDKLILKNMIE